MHPTAERLRTRLLALGLEVEVRMLSDSSRTADEAAAAVGCDVGQIVKSLVFVRAEAPVMVLCAGDRRVDAKRLGLRSANADQARAATGFAIGGIPPLGHDRDLETMIDASLRRFETVWCAAGTPHAVFEVRTDALIGAIPSAMILDVAQLLGWLELPVSAGCAPIKIGRAQFERLAKAFSGEIRAKFL